MATAIAAKLLVNLKYYCELAHMQNVVTDSVLGSTYISVCRQVNLQFIDMHYDIVFELQSRPVFIWCSNSYIWSCSLYRSYEMLCVYDMGLSDWNIQLFADPD